MGHAVAPYSSELRSKANTQTGKTIGPCLKFVEHDSRSACVYLSVLFSRFEADAPQQQNTNDEVADDLQLTWSSDQGGEPTHVKPELLDVYQNWCFYSFPLCLQLGAAAQAITYTVVQKSTADDPPSPSYTFHLPASDSPMRWGFYSCNGFHDPEIQKKFGGIQPLWHDVLAKHKEEPFHLLVGGGDQIYNDAVWKVPSLQAWLALLAEDRHGKGLCHPFTEEMKTEVEDAYMLLYMKHWQEAIYSDALTQIPNMMTLDDHELFDGYGSHIKELRDSPVFQGVFRAARRFYGLFQQHTTEARNEQSTRGKLFGANGGWNSATTLGNKHAILLLDTRSERTRPQIITPDSWKMIEEKIAQLPETIEFCTVVTAVPFVHPEIRGALEMAGCCTKLVRPCRGAVHDNLHRLGHVFDAFGNVGVLDDLLDGWNADVHLNEKQTSIQMFQRLALQEGKKPLRFSFIAGDVHLAAVGHFASQEDTPRLEDPRFMQQITSSAIGNAPPPAFVVKKVKQSSGFSKKLDANTKEAMDNAFGSGKRVRASRNWCSVSAEEQEGVPSLSFNIRCEPEGAYQPKAKVTEFTVRVPCLRPAKAVD